MKAAAALIITATVTSTANGRPHAVNGALTEGPDDSLYVPDDRGGRIWRIIFVGS